MVIKPFGALSGLYANMGFVVREEGRIVEHWDMFQIWIFPDIHRDFWPVKTSNIDHIYGYFIGRFAR